MIVESIIQIAYVTRVLGVDEGDQSLTVTTPGGYTFKLPETAWNDLQATGALSIIETPVTIGEVMTFEATSSNEEIEPIVSTVEITDAVVPPIEEEQNG